MTVLQDTHKQEINESTSAMSFEHELEITVTRLYEQYHAPVFAYLFRLVNDRGLADDLLQETFLRLYRSGRQLAAVENQRAWLYRIATNTALNSIKRQRRFSWLPWRQGDETVLPAEAIAARTEERLAVERVLAQLPPKYRAPLLLHSAYSFSIREVAQALDINEGAVKTRLFRARELFRKIYKDQEDGHEGSPEI